MDQTEKLADRIKQTLPKVPSVTLRFWGEWFGRPYDNCHTLARVFPPSRDREGSRYSREERISCEDLPIK